MSDDTKLQSKSIDDYFERAKASRLQNGKLQCPFCEKQCDSRGFKSHIKIHPHELTSQVMFQQAKCNKLPNGKLQCQFCSREIDSRGYKSHLKSHNKDSTEMPNLRMSRDDHKRMSESVKSQFIKPHLKTTSKITQRVKPELATPSKIPQSCKTTFVTRKLQSESIDVHFERAKANRLQNGKLQCPFCENQLDSRGFKSHIKTHYRHELITNEVMIQEAKCNKLPSVMLQCQICFKEIDSRGYKNHFESHKDKHSTSTISKDNYKTPKNDKSILAFSKACRKDTKIVQAKIIPMHLVIRDTHQKATDLIEAASYNSYKILTSRLEDLTLRKTDIMSKAQKINLLEQHLRQSFDENCILGIKYKLTHTGSYYEKVKISNVDEIDWLVVCDLPVDTKVEYERSEQRSFIGLQVVSQVWEKQCKLCTKDGHLSPILFKKYIEKLIGQACRTFDECSLSISKSIKAQHPNSPAITVCMKTTPSHLYMDFVPAIEFDGWPDVSKKWGIPAKLQTSKDEIKCKYHIVPKMHPSELSLSPSDCKLWRLSYSSAEKLIITRMDFVLDKELKPCRKDVLRLLKSDLYRAKEEDQEEIFTQSYIAKTIIMHMIKEYSRDTQWDKDKTSNNFLHRYIQSLLVFIKCLAQGFVEHFFIKDEDILKISYSELGGESGVQNMIAYLQETITETLGL